jgi:hypothetical protein
MNESEKQFSLTRAASLKGWGVKKATSYQSQRLRTALKIIILSCRVFAASALVMVFTAGCATPYQKTGFAGGFSEKQLRWNEFVVGFGGNGYTTGQRAVDLCLMRCAELALSHGFNYFTITGGRNAVDTSTSVTTGSYTPTGYGGGVWLSTSQQIAKPSTLNRILCFRFAKSPVRYCGNL